MKPRPRNLGDRISERGVGNLPAPRIFALALSAILAVAPAGCDHEQDMPERMEMPDTMPVMRALENPSARDSMLDSMPGGEMVRGDSAAAMRLLKKKM